MAGLCLETAFSANANRKHRQKTSQRAAFRARKAQETNRLRIYEIRAGGLLASV
jgi:hypothetical protein